MVLVPRRHSTFSGEELPRFWQCTNRAHPIGLRAQPDILANLERGPCPTPGHSDIFGCPWTTPIDV